jgi:DnaJ-class molecular chaperone
MFSEEMIYCGSKNNFCKKSGGLLFSAKVQNHPGFSKIGRNLHKIQKIPPKAAAIK